MKTRTKMHLSRTWLSIFGLVMLVGFAVHEQSTAAQPQPLRSVHGPAGNTSNRSNRPSRMGVHIRFASVGSAGGLQGNAFLPVVSDDIDYSPDGGCGGRPKLTFSGKLRRGPVRMVKFVVQARPQERALVLRDCPHVSMEMTLENGGTLTATDGWVQVANAIPGAVTANFRAAYMLNGEPIVVNGTYILPLMPPPTSAP